MSTESTLKIIFGGASHRRTSGYGWRVHPTKKTKKFHYGVDYGCGKVAVHALESGVVYKLSLIHISSAYTVTREKTVKHRHPSLP